jgi:outer membrane protein
MELQQEREALENLVQEVEKEVLNACVEIARSVDQIEATEVTVLYQQKKLQTELDRYSMGISTMYPVAQAERDLVLSQINEVRARIDFLKGLVQLYLSEGSLLARRGIGFPGDKPMEPQGDEDFGESENDKENG